MPSPTTQAEGTRRRVWIARLVTALAQGLLLFLLHRAGEAEVWPATVPALFGPLVMIAAFVPVLLLGGIGRLPWRPLALWAGAAAVVLAALAWHDAVQRAPGDLGNPSPYPAPVLAFVSAVALFIAHHLVQGAVLSGRRIAPFALYFDTAWKAGVQLALSVAFLAVFWILLGLGASLFTVIGLDFLETLIRQDWFHIPVTALVFALGVQLTDVADGLIRGVRTVGLTLLSWLAPVMTLLVVGFLLALPFTGLQLLWATRSATALVLAAMAALIVLINAGYQDGSEETRPHPALRWAARIAALALVPMAVLAAWGLAQRLGQHGLTPERVWAGACVLLGFVYAGGYAFAAVRPGPWMRPLERTNVIAAVATVGLILALFSPLADPARLSVNDQMRRLARGDVGAGQFDYAFLRFGAGRHGQAALARLAASDDAEVARRAREAQALEHRWQVPPPARDAATPAADAVEMVPDGAAPPPGLLAALHGLEGQTCRRSGDCVARTLDLDGDGDVDALVATEAVVLAFTREDDAWVFAGRHHPACGNAGLRDALRNGEIDVRPAPQAELSLDGRRFGLMREADPCAGATP